MPTTAIYGNLTLQIDSIFSWLCVFCTFFLQRSTPLLDGTVLRLPKSHIIPFLAYTAIPSPLHTATYHYVELSLNCRALKKHHTAKDSDALLLFSSYKTQWKTHWVTQGALTFFSSDSIYTNSIFFPRWSKIVKISMDPSFSSHEQLQQILPLLIQTQVKSKRADVFTDNREAITRSRQPKLRICEWFQLFFLVCKGLRCAKKISI